MIVGVAIESHPGERRVAVVPAVVPALAKAGAEILLERGAGEQAGFPDDAYERQGARLASDRNEVLSSADVLVCVHGLVTGGEESNGDVEHMHAGQVVVGLLDPWGSAAAVRALAARGVTAFALELLPRISRAQPMDALTSMATVAGYKAVLLGAGTLDKMCPMMITAAGTITPAHVFIVGAGVAGLQAIATARRLGAVVEAYDVRPAVKEQVESLGGKFVELDLETGEAETSGGYAQAMGEEFYRRQREKMLKVVSGSDVVITTAAIPGKPAPKLVTDEMVRQMRPGTVVVDLAAEGGGNCELTRAGETVLAHGVNILGPVNLAATVPHHASQMYAKNVAAFVRNLTKEKEIQLDFDDPIIHDALLTYKGEIVHPQLREAFGLPTLAEADDPRRKS